ncbi:MAG: hypothetical protein MZV70_67825 [Desulfobacterales bacterium]|nr:hypothetical protein [Desulfobacterales bacterium]
MSAPSARMDCAYCILQSYFHPPVLQYFVNHDGPERRTGAAASPTGTIHRLGTGEFTDSLIWEPWTDLSAGLVRTIRRPGSLRAGAEDQDHLHRHARWICRTAAGRSCHGP